MVGLPVVASGAARPGDIAFAELLAGPAAEATATPEDHAKYLLTSGSTGHPKAVICSHANVSLNSAQIEACYDDLDGHARWLAPAPFVAATGAHYPTA